MSRTQTVADIAEPRLAEIWKFEQVSINIAQTVAEIAGPRLAEIRKFEHNTLQVHTHGIQ